MKRAIVLVDHGSKFEQANAALVQMGALVQANLGSDWIVQIAHMELVQPSLSAACAACVDAGVTEVIVHPYFLSPGRHASVDIARMVEEVAAAHPHVQFRVTEPLGVHPLLAQLVLERCGLGEKR
ncbi:MAG TPA: CbiX/SirB N-terminal domain-containing protein [Polyangiaceae bacterium]|jgi:sirohydrochlorin ferrochelatase|nr:CbiX/SirB N-terminal domain-containing protein [Polyangiaceae bacterium]